MKALKTVYSQLKVALFSPVDASGLAVVRMLFGLIIIYESSHYIDLSRIVMKFNEQSFYFKFRFFEWVEPISIAGMQWLFLVYGIAGLAISLGVFYRLATPVAALCISYIFLIDSTNYLNHFYLVIIFSIMMFFIPANKCWSIYAWINPRKASSTVPGWCIWLIRAQLVIVYSYAAIAKMNVDWINGMPLYDWIGGEADDRNLESFLGEPWSIYAFTYLGLLYDLIIAPLLLIRKTRAFAFCLTISFHLTNYYLFNIGIFPWFMLAASTIFFEPSWARSFLNFFIKERFLPLAMTPFRPQALSFIQKCGLFVMILHLTFQALFPLRHFFYGNYVGWSEEGHNFSWHMKLRDKNGDIAFRVVDPDTREYRDIPLEYYLTERQIIKMTGRPAMIVQFAHFLRDHYTEKDEKPAEVYAETWLSINGRKPQRLIDPNVDLAKVSMKESHNSWILPLKQPVWNASGKKNRFGPAFQSDEIANIAIPDEDTPLFDHRHALSAKGSS